MATISERIRKKRRDWKQKDDAFNEQESAVERIKQQLLNDDHFLLAGLQFLDMAKDFLDTGKRYKSRHHVWRDAAQSLQGLMNIIVKPLFLIIAALVFAIGGVVHSIYNAFFGDGSEKSLDILKAYLYQAAGFLVHAITSAIRGITQLVAAPLTWLRMMGRGIYTAIKGWQPFTANAGAQAAIDKADSWLDDNRDASELEAVGYQCITLQAKLYKAVSQGQPIDIDAGDETWELTDEIEKGNGIQPHKIYIKKIGPKSFGYLTTLTTNPSDPKSTPKLVEVNLADVEPSFQEEFDDSTRQHRALVWKIAIKNGHIDPADAFIQVRDELNEYYQNEAVQPTEANRNNPAVGKFNDKGLALARNYLTLFGASAAEPAEPRPAYQWDAERNLPHLSLSNS